MVAMTTTPRSRRAAALTSREIEGLPAAIDLVTACRALNISRSKGYELLAVGEFPIPALRVGSIWRFRAADLRSYLGIEEAAPDGVAPEREAG